VYGYALLDAIIGSRRIQSIRLNRYTRWYVYPCIFLLHALIIPPLLERNKAVDTYVIKSSAMSDSLLAGDYVATAARDYTPAFQDVVIFKHPADTSLHFVMRLVGLPGDTIMVKNKSVRRNGVELAEPYVLHVDPYTIPVVCEAPPQGESPGCPCRDNIAAFTVPPDRYFVMGDNRDASKDSRCFGFVPEENILGKALYVYFSKEPETNSIRFGRLGMLME
jgi:signal peptidase I